MDEYRHPRGSLIVETPAPGVLSSRGVGHLTLDAALRLVTGREALLTDQASFVEFHDWSALTGYDSASRRLLTAHSIAHRDLILRIHILTGSLIVRMGVAAAAPRLSGTLYAYVTRDAFDAAREKHIPRASGPA